jgi:hypothetical protein
MGLLLRDRIRRAGYRATAATVARSLSEGKGRGAQKSWYTRPQNTGKWPGSSWMTKPPILALVEEVERQAHQAPKDE